MIISRKGALICFFLLSISVVLVSIIKRNYFDDGKHNLNIKQLPLNFANWQGYDTPDLDQRSQNTLKLDQYIRRLYKDTEGNEVFIYIGYWKSQSGDHQAAKHSPLLCLPGNGWKISEVKKRKFNLNNFNTQQINLETSQLIGRNKNFRALFTYWFLSGKLTYSDETAALFNIIKQTFLEKRSDGAIIELSVNLNSSHKEQLAEEKSQLITEKFLNDFYPELDKIIASSS